MLVFLFSLLILVCLAVIGWGLTRRGRVIEFPFLMACVYAGWLIPQLVGLTNNTTLPKVGLEKTIFMATLCLTAAWWGYTKNKVSAKSFQWRFSHERLKLGSAVLSLLGAFFFYKVSLLAAEVTVATGGQWSGIITIYVFFGDLLTVGMAIALVLYIKTPSAFALSVLLFDLAFYLDRIILKGRRAAMAELGLMVLMAMWFQRRWLPPRWAMVAALMLATLVINSIGDYRSTMLADDMTTYSHAGLKEILDIDYVGNIQRIFEGKSGNDDLENAVMNIEAADRAFTFDLGLSHWNGFVKAYIPGQWVGREFKRSLMIDFGNIAYSEYQYIPHVGSTSTGLSDSFLSFWYVGAIKFFLIGLIMSRWYRAALKDRFVAQIIVMLAITPSLHAITHSTHLFFVFFVKLAAFLIPVLVFARVQETRIRVPKMSQSSPRSVRIYSERQE